MLSLFSPCQYSCCAILDPYQVPVRMLLTRVLLTGGGSTYLFNVHVEIHMLVKNDSRFQRILETSKISSAVPEFRSRI